jgi:crossover junction endodeoxyribonuclease RuvC
MILAIDPGLRGALARYDGEHLSVVDMPLYQPPGGRVMIDENRLCAILRIERSRGATHLYIEKVGGIPRQSAPAAFTFGRGVGVILGAARGLGYLIYEIHPATWKSALRVPADKTHARERASELLPAWSNLWTRKKDDGRAEAGMLAVYGWQMKGRLRHDV